MDGSQSELRANKEEIPQTKPSGGLPLVSCLMPTFDRRHFATQAIKYFLEQDYPNKELIIIDDGEDKIANIVPENPAIFYYQLSEQRPIGEKRNIACEKSHGDLIAHWDDDDWHAMNRLSTQVKGLLDSRADICGLRDLYYFQPGTGTAWLYVCLGQRRWIAGGTMMYRKTLWEKNKFPVSNGAEDTQFLNQVTVDKILELQKPDLYVGILHDKNSSAKFLDDPSWRQVPLGVVAQLITKHREFYVQLRAAIKNGTNGVTTGRSMAEKMALQAAGRKNLRSDNLRCELVEPASKNPLVSCIMPTSDRPAFVKQSIGYFLQQSYSHSELIVIDDGKKPLGTVVPDHPRIKYIRLSRPYSIGKKRNIGCEAADGEIIMCWDDDDWYGRHRIREQVYPLVAEKYDASAIGSYLYLSLTKKQFWRYRSMIFYQGLVGGTFTFWKILWQQGERFQDTSLAEDAALQKAFLSKGARIKRVMTEDIFFIVRHGNNTWNFDEAGLTTESVPVPDFIPENDLKFYGLSTPYTNIHSMDSLEVNQINHPYC